MFFTVWIRGILSSTEFESRRQTGEPVRHVQLYAVKSPDTSICQSRPSNI